jgi:hypothetical protein
MQFLPEKIRNKKLVDVGYAHNCNYFVTLAVNYPTIPNKNK